MKRLLNQLLLFIPFFPTNKFLHICLCTCVEIQRLIHAFMSSSSYCCIFFTFVFKVSFGRCFFSQLNIPRLIVFCNTKREKQSKFFLQIINVFLLVSSDQFDRSTHRHSNNSFFFLKVLINFFLYLFNVVCFSTSCWHLKLHIWFNIKSNANLFIIIPLWKFQGI